MLVTLENSVIRPWQPGDGLSLVRHANSRHIWVNLLDDFPHPYTMMDAREWIRVTGTQKVKTDFAITVGGMAVGGVGFRLGADVFRKSAEIGFWLGEEYWGRGIMTEVVTAMSEWAFGQFDLHRVFAQIFAWNQPSMRVLEKAGYKYEGRLRSSAVKDGTLVDQMMYALVRE